MPSPLAPLPQGEGNKRPFSGGLFISFY